LGFSDSHCHLDSYPPEELSVVFDEMAAQAVELVLNPSIDLDTSEAVVRLAAEHDTILAAIGIHPGEAVAPTDEVLQCLDDLSRRPRVVALGEIGLHYGPKPGSKEGGDEHREWQKDLLRCELALAKARRVPVNIHYTLAAHGDLMAILREEDSRGVQGMCHGFQGGLDELRDWLDLGFYVSVGPNSLGLVKTPHDTVPPLTDEVLRAIPEERLLTETDAICMRPTSLWKRPRPPADSEEMKAFTETFRQPVDVIGAAARIALARGTTAEEIGGMATANLRRVLKRENFR
jgi:TatD DNase family protein